MLDLYTPDQSTRLMLRGNVEITAVIEGNCYICVQGEETQTIFLPISKFQACSYLCSYPE